MYKKNVISTEVKRNGEISDSVCSRFLDCARNDAEVVNRFWAFVENDVDNRQIRDKRLSVFKNLIVFRKTRHFRRPF